MGHQRCPIILRDTIISELYIIIIEVPPRTPTRPNFKKN